MVLCISIIASPMKAESFDFMQNDFVSGSYLSLNTLKMTSNKKEEAFQFEFEGMMENTPFKINGYVGPLIFAIDPKLKWPIQINLNTAGANLTIRGTINDLNQFKGVDLDFVFAGQNLAGFEDMLGIKFPAVEFTLKGNLKDNQPLKYELSGVHLVMGKSEVKGSCFIDLSQNPPHIKADFYASFLDLTKILGNNDISQENGSPEKFISDTAVQSSHRRKVFSDNPFNLKSLKSLNAKIDLSVEKLLLPRVALKNFQLQASVLDGGMIIDSLTSGIGEGHLTASFKMEPLDEKFVVSSMLDIKRMDLHKMLEDMEATVKGEGMLDLSLNLSGKGNSLSELMAGLGGDASLVLGEGRIDRNYLRFLGLFRINLISSIVNILSIPVGIGKKEDTSVTNCFVMRFDINKGIANLTAFILDTPQTTIAADGRIDLSTEKVDIYLKPISKEGIGAKGVAKFNLSLSELTRVLYIGGTLANPSVAFDSTQTVVTLGKAIGGVVLFGPAGVAAALLSGKIGGGSQNLCMEAIEAAQKGVEFSEERKGLLKRFGNFLKKLNPFN